VISFTPRLLYSQGTSPWYPLDSRLGGPQSGSGHCVEEKNYQPYWDSNPDHSIVQPVTSRNTSSVGIALGYGLDDRDSRVRFPAGAGNFSLHRVQNGSGAHSASYPMGTRVSFPAGKAAGA
jgi:hypothetical protein